MSVESFSPITYQNSQIEKDILNGSAESTTRYPDELQYVLQRTPRIQDVNKIHTEKVFDIVKEKPFAVDLSDELRKIRAIKDAGDDPQTYWNFFKSHMEYYSNEAYAKLGVISYEHQLVNDNGNIRLWIEAMGKSAKDSYAEAAMKGGPDWYKARCNRETVAIDEWERQLQFHLGNTALVEVSPAPFEVDKRLLKGTMFGNHSFLRIHQLVYDENGKPSVYSKAFRTYLPPHKLEEAYAQFTGEHVPWQTLLGRFAPMPEAQNSIDIRDEQVSIAVRSILNQMWEETPIEERPHLDPGDSYAMKLEEMTDHYHFLEPFLKDVFDQMAQDKDPNEDEQMFLNRVVEGFRTWEKMLQARISGDWDKQIVKYMVQHDQKEDDPLAMQRMYQYYEQQEYNPAANACGTGSGASTLESSGLMGSQSVFSGVMNYEGLSFMGEENKSVDVHCPGCNKTNTYSVAEVKRAGKLQCKSCSNCTDCWEAILMAAMKQQRT